MALGYILLHIEAVLVTRMWLSLGKGTLSLDSPSVFSPLPLLMHLSSELMYFFRHVSTVNQIIAKWLGMFSL